MSHIIFDQAGHAHRLLFTPDSRLLISAANENYGKTDDDRTSIIVFDLGSGAEARRIYDRHSFAPYVTVSPDGRMLAVSNRQQVSLWNVSDGSLIRTLLDVQSTRCHPGYLEVAFSPDGGRIAFGVSQTESKVNVRDGDLYLVDILSGERLQTLQTGELRCAMTLQFSPDGLYLTGIGYTYDALDRVYTWDLTSGQRLATLKPEGYDEAWYALSPQGRFVADGGKSVRVWERNQQASAGEQAWTLRSECAAQKYGARYTVFSADESLIAALGPEALTHKDDPHLAYSVMLIDTASGQRLATCPVEGRCFCYGLSHDGGTLATMSAQVPYTWSRDAPEYFVTLWDVPTGRKRTTLATPSRQTNQLFHAPQAMAFSPNDRWLAVSHHEHFEIWDLKNV